MDSGPVWAGKAMQDSWPTCATWQPAHIRQGGAAVRATCILIFTKKILPEFIYGQNAKDGFTERRKKKKKKKNELAEMLSTSLLAA